MLVKPNVTTEPRPTDDHVLTCGTCGQTADNPWRDRLNGSVRYGCIDRAHNEHADDWHNRPEAQAMRDDKPAEFIDLGWGIAVDRNRDWTV